MKARVLTDFEIRVLHAVKDLGEAAYPLSILHRLEEEDGKMLAIVAIDLALAQLEEAGCVNWQHEEGTPERGKNPDGSFRKRRRYWLRRWPAELNQGGAKHQLRASIPGVY